MNTSMNNKSLFWFEPKYEELAEYTQYYLPHINRQLGATRAKRANRGPGSSGKCFMFQQPLHLSID
jgi:hypothetical protein